MAGHLLFVILIYSFHEMKAQASLPPKLTVNPLVITETDSVTLNCQAPASVSVTECFFRTTGKPAKRFSCLKTLTGTELLEITNQSPPAEVKVTCFYLIAYQSPDSDVSSISIQPSFRPKLTVNPPLITETDSVTLHCQSPRSVLVSQCYFYTLSGGTISVLSCLQTLTGTELLKMAHQSSPAEVEVKCFYAGKFGETYFHSPHSDSSSITIQSQKPQMSYQHVDGDSVLFTCSLPGSAKHDTRCNLYFGEASHPVKTITIWRETTSTNQKFCQFTVSIDDLLKHLRSVLRKDASCDYTLGSEPSSLSPRSDRYSLTALFPPELTVNPPVITETDSVTLNCQTPPSVSVSQCYFYTLSGGSVRVPSCMKTLTGTELLKMAHQSSPAEVEVKCYYTVTHGETNSPSLHSDTSSITIQTLFPPKLTVNPPVITETDSVTLNCQTPASVSVSQCFFYTLSGGTVRVLPCMKTLTGTELLKMAHQSSPAEVEVKCYYTVTHGETNSHSLHSDSSSITIKSQKPQVSLQHFDGDSVLFTCSLPGSAKHDTRCNLYFGEASHPVKTITIWRETTSTNRKFCQFTVSIDDLLKHLRSVLRKDASCDYTFGSELNSLSPRSDGNSLTDIVDKESSKMQTTPTLTMTTGLNVNTPRTSTPLTPTQSTSEADTGMTDKNQGSGDEITGSSVSKPGTTDSPNTPMKTVSGTGMWKIIAVVAGCGVTVGIILLVSVIIRNQRGAGSKELKTREPQNTDSDTHRVYCEISQEPTAIALRDMVYSAVEAH